MKNFLILAPIITVMLLVTTYASDNGLFQLQVLAQSFDKVVNNTNSPVTTEKMSIMSAATPGQIILYRWIGASKEPVHLDFPQQDRQPTLNILSNRDDGASYRGL